MNRTRSLSLALFAASLGVLNLAGCSGIGSNSFPDTGYQTPLGTIQGSNYGGHAPLVGSHIYVLQASTSGYGAAATSLLGASYQTTSYPTTEDISDPYIPTATPWYYVTADSTGAFNISGDYTCTSGLPVYLYAYGGAPTTTFSTAAISSFKSITAATSGSTLQFTTNFAATSGEQIILSGFTAPYTYLNGQSGTVLAADLTSTTFELSGLTGVGSLTVNNTYTAAGTATLNTSFNPAAVNLLMLGVCPSSGNFSTGGTLFNGSTFTPLNYVYVNEVSTVATAYAMAGFGTDGLHIGTGTATAATLTAPGVRGIQNATMNAGNLYDIQGKYISSSFSGEGHIAAPTTVNGSGNGTVPQATLDTLANILAACVGSNNTYNPVTGTGTKNANCTGTTASTTSPSVLLNASSNGGNTGGTTAPNTAAAAFNIAHYPMTANVVALYSLPQGTVPFTPHLTSAPNDFTVGIIYSSSANGTSGASATSSIASPTSVAIDSYGDAYVSATTSSSNSTITKLSPLGVVSATSSSATGATVPGYMSFAAIDQAGNIWASTVGSDVGGQSGNGALYKFNAGLTTVSQIATGLYAPTSIAIDTSNNIFVAQSNSYPGGGGNFAEFAGGGSTETLISSSCSVGATSLAVTNSSSHEFLWSATNTGNTTCTTPVSNGAGKTSTALSDPYNISIDSNGLGWVATHNQTNLYTFDSSNGHTTAYGVNNNNFIAGMYDPAWTAIDGANNIFIVNDNGTNSSVSEVSNAGVALSCPACATQGNTLYGYQPGNVSSVSATKMDSFTTGNIAVDPSGNIWVANYSGSTVLEIIGVGTPVVTPLSSMQYGVKP